MNYEQEIKIILLVWRDLSFRSPSGILNKILNRLKNKLFQLFWNSKNVTFRTTKYDLDNDQIARQEWPEQQITHESWYAIKGRNQNHNVHFKLSRSSK